MIYFSFNKVVYIGFFFFFVHFAFEIGPSLRRVFFQLGEFDTEVSEIKFEYLMIGWSPEIRLVYPWALGSIREQPIKGLWKTSSPPLLSVMHYKNFKSIIQSKIKVGLAKNVIGVQVNKVFDRHFDLNKDNMVVRVSSYVFIMVSSHF